MLTFVDSGVLIAAAPGQPVLFEPSIAVRGDPERRSASSDFVRLEVEPKALYEARDAEARFYAAFFRGTVQWIAGTPDLVEVALGHARQFGLNALDALHVAAALAVGCDELITTEGPTKPIFRVDLIPIVSIRSGRH